MQTLNTIIINVVQEKTLCAAHWPISRARDEQMTNCCTCWPVQLLSAPGGIHNGYNFHNELSGIEI